MAGQTSYSSFSDFYPDYLRAHQNRTCRRLHFLGTTLVILILPVLGMILYFLFGRRGSGTTPTR